jgi:hypothetical protein
MSEDKLFSDEEISEMFDHGFLKIITDIAHRAKEKKLKDKDVKFYQVSMRYQFNDGEMVEKYEQIKDRIAMQIQPITQEDLDRAKEEANENHKETAEKTS